MVEIKFQRLPHGQGLPLPSFQTPGAAGMDICAAESFKLGHGGTKLFATGFAVEVPEGYELQVRSRSGLAAKHGIFVTNGPGTIDSDYRGEIMVILSCLGRQSHQIERGDRIAQLVLAPVVRDIKAVETEALTMNTLRGARGFGSTGT